MRKILQIVGNSSFGGATYLMVEWSRYLLDRGCDVAVLTADRQTCEVLAGVPGVRIIDNIQIPRDISPRADAAAVARLVLLLLRERFDVVHTYTATPGFVGRLSAWLCSVPVVVHHQAGWPVMKSTSTARRLLYQWLEYTAVLLSSRAICVSHALMDQAVRDRLAPPSRLVVIRNGIRTEGLSSLDGKLGAAYRAARNLAPHRLVVGLTSRLSRYKGVGTAISAFAAVCESLPQLEPVMLIAGDGPERAALELQARSECRPGRVLFLGFEPDIPSLLDAVDIFLQPSLDEGLSISLLEAMTAGKAIVSSSIPPNAEVVRDGDTGLVFEAGNACALSDAICRLALDDRLKASCARNARRSALAEFRIERMFDETWHLYKHLYARYGK